MTREDAIRKAINIVAYFEAHFAKSKEARENAAEIIEKLEQEPRTGRWFAWRPEDDVWRTTCSECGEETRTLWDYCPHCGVKMEVE